MSRSRENMPLTYSQLSRYNLTILVFCLTFVTAAPAQGQKVSNPANSVTAAKSCEGKPPAAHQGSADSQSAAEGGTDRLKLSTNAAQESLDPQGQFCKRERSSQNSLRPSVAADQPDAATEPAQSATTPPIAQLTDGKLTIRANGQDFASVLESVRSATGVSVEMPPGMDSEPIFLTMGPAPITEALVALMDGSDYNYIIVGSDKDPRLVKQLILTRRTSTAPAMLVASTQGAPAAQATLYGGQGVEADAEAEASEPPPPAVPTQPTAVPSSVPTGINIQQLAAQSNKTPGQILDELQKRQQQVLDDQAASQSQSAPQQ